MIVAKRAGMLQQGMDWKTRTRRLLLAVSVSAVTFCLLLVGGGEEMALGALPLFFLVLALVADRYPGEETIERLRRARRGSPRERSQPAFLDRTDFLFVFRILVLATSRPLRAPPSPSSL